MFAVEFVVALVVDEEAAVLALDEDGFLPEAGDRSPVVGSDRRSLGCKNEVMGVFERIGVLAGVSPSSSAFIRRHNSSRSRSFLFSLKKKLVYGEVIGGVGFLVNTGYLFEWSTWARSGEAGVGATRF